MSYIPDPEMDYLHGDSDELTMYKRLVELYQNGAVIEYHEPFGNHDGRYHVGFRYDCMSDDDYFESQELERRLNVREDKANWRGDSRKV